MASKAPYPDYEIKEFIDYLQTTLIPDCYEAYGPESGCAEDFEKCIAIIKQLANRENRRATERYKLLCVDCGNEVGGTDCEITATSYHLCDSCHGDDLNRHGFTD